MEMFKDLSMQLCSITGFDAMSLQPNSGASGEYAGLMGIRAYHQSRCALLLFPIPSCHCQCNRIVLHKMTENVLGPAAQQRGQYGVLRTDRHPRMPPEQVGINTT